MEVNIYNFIIFTAKCVQRPLGHVEPQRLPKKSCALLLALRSSYSPTVNIQLKILLLACCSHLLENFIFNHWKRSLIFFFYFCVVFLLKYVWVLSVSVFRTYIVYHLDTCTSAGTSCSVRNGSSTFSSTSTLDFSSCGSVDEDWKISGRSSPVFSSTLKEKGQPKEDGCTPPVNVRLLSDYIFLPCPSH